MKSLYESLLTGKVSKPSALVQPQSREELWQLIDNHINDVKPHPGQEVDLNWIDISKVDDLSFLFDNTNYIPVIDKWEIDHVKMFKYMFADNKYITESPLPRLQKKLLEINCYEGMFVDCTSLVQAPELPAEKLIFGCYKSMFSGCSSLVQAPELPAKKLTVSCYRSMFSGCSSLVQAPELPARDLAMNCYKNMFDGCEKLQIPPDLPAKKLERGCYVFMFLNCVSLTRTAKKPQTFGDPNSMFGIYTGCKLIDYITKEDL